MVVHKIFDQPDDSLLMGLVGAKTPNVLT